MARRHFANGPHVALHVHHSTGVMRICDPPPPIHKPKGTPEMAKKPVAKTTGVNAAAAAAHVLADPAATKAEKKAAASALTQAHNANETTGKKAATAASQVLADPKSSKAAKTAAASALAQKVKKK